MTGAYLNCPHCYNNSPLGALSCVHCGHGFIEPIERAESDAADAALLAKLCNREIEMAVREYGHRSPSAGRPLLSVDYSSIDLTDDEADRLVELGAHDERRRPADA